VHARAGAELRGCDGEKEKDLVLEEALKEVQTVAISFIASSLSEDDLFETSADPISQVLELYRSRDPSWDGTNSSPSSLILPELINEGSIEDYLTSLVSALLPALATPDAAQGMPPPSVDSAAHLDALRTLQRVFHHQSHGTIHPAPTIPPPPPLSSLPPPPAPPAAAESAAPDSAGMTPQQLQFMQMIRNMQQPGSAGAAPPGSFPTVSWVG
jgi:hypothetical protein